MAQGLALLSMVCNLTAGKKRFSAVEAQIRSALKQLSAMQEEALTEAEADITAFTEVMKAYRLPETDMQKSTKQDAWTGHVKRRNRPLGL